MGMLLLLSTAMQTISSISAIASFTAVIIYLRFPHLQRKSYFTLQFWVAVSNVLTSIGSAIGVSETGTVECWFQGILTNVFTLSSIQWTTVMTLSLFSIVHYQKQIEVTPLVHLYCWIPPILATFLPLINSTYGNVGNWCWVVDTSHTPPWGAAVWFWVSFYGWVWLGLLMMVFILANIKYVSMKRNADVGKNHAKLDRVIHTLNLFPIIIFFSWAPACASDTMLILFNVYNLNFGAVTLLMACTQGFLTAIVFWTRNDEPLRLLPQFFQLDSKVHTTRSSFNPDSLNNSSYESELNTRLSTVLKTDQTNAVAANFVVSPATNSLRPPSSKVALYEDNLVHEF